MPFLLEEQLCMPNKSYGQKILVHLMFLYYHFTRNVDDVRAPIPQTRGILVEPYQGMAI